MTELHFAEQLKSFVCIRFVTELESFETKDFLQKSKRKLVFNSDEYLLKKKH